MKTLFTQKVSPEQEINIKDWIAALRSGDYIQSPKGGMLKNKHGYCCLGVCCEIADIETRETQIHDGRIEFIFGDLSSVAYPTMDWFINRFGFDFTRSICETKFGHKTLAGINDQGVSFAVIADILEAVFIKQEIYENHTL